ncbi:MAG: hypothetical protein Q9209_001892 [Squamulea sp. 1 TL-2023]
MDSQLFARALGSVGPEAIQQAELSRRLHAIQPVPDIKFDGHGPQPTTNDGDQHNRSRGAIGNEIRAHRAGVNCIAIDRFEGRHLISGGAEASIKIWDLATAEHAQRKFINNPTAEVKKSPTSHQYGITHVCFYPFDSQAFISSSYDHKLKVYSTDTMSASATFDLDSVIYSHSISSIAHHLLVACATQHSAVRLVDLRSGANAHSLAGHQRAVLSVAWSPHEEYILASGSSDGTARLWDIRRSANSLGVLDLEDSVGIEGEDGLGKNARDRNHGKAHTDVVNGVVWTDDGRYLVTAGHDERVRVWDMATGANDLAHFGPIIKNKHLSTLLPLLVPSHALLSRKQVMFYPNQKEILMFDLFRGTLLKRLRLPGVVAAPIRGSTAQGSFRNRTTSLAWKADDVGLYSAHADGVIRVWLPITPEDLQADNSEDQETGGDEDETRKRKRDALEDIFRDLTRQKITFT